MKKTLSITRRTLVALAVFGALQAHAADTIKIGVPVGLSGANSVVAPSVVQSAELAVEEINAKGGVLGRQLELVVADDGSGAAGAQKAFDSLKAAIAFFTISTFCSEIRVHLARTIWDPLGQCPAWSRAANGGGRAWASLDHCSAAQASVLGASPDAVAPDEHEHGRALTPRLPHRTA